MWLVVCFRCSVCVASQWGCVCGFCMCLGVPELVCPLSFPWVSLLCLPARPVVCFLCAGLWCAEPSQMIGVVFGA